MTQIKALPLSGVQVLELGHIVAGPTAGMLLQHLGATVIKVEPPGQGDQARNMPSSGSGMFPYLNANKQSLALNLKDPRGLDILYRLIPDTQVVVTNYADGVAERLGVSYESLSKANPRLVYAQIGGFLPGPYHGRPALDEVVEMMSGLAFMTGPAGRPLRAGAPVIDMTASCFAVMGVLSALLHAERTGQGQRIESALYESSLFYMGQQIATHELTKEPSLPFPERGVAGRNGWGVYDIFVCKDSKKLFLAITSDKHWRSFCAKFGLNDLLSDERYAHNRDRVAMRPILIPHMQALLQQWTYDDLSAILLVEKIPFAPVRSPEEVLAEESFHPQFQTVEYHGQRLNVPAFALHADWQRTGSRTDVVDASEDVPSYNKTPTHVPELGEHTEQILTGLGMSLEAATDLEKAGVVQIYDRKIQHKKEGQ